MIGNDIVDLKLAEKESRWNRKGFLEKIFTEEEQVLIFQEGNPEKRVWILWSIKEAAYKIYNRETGIRAYFPLQIQILKTDFKKNIVFGIVKCKEELYETRTIITPEYIYTIAVKNPADFKKLVPIGENKIQKDDCDRPYYCNEKSNEKIPVSKTHHGRFQKIITLQA